MQPPADTQVEEPTATNITVRTPTTGRRAPCSPFAHRHFLPAATAAAAIGHRIGQVKRCTPIQLLSNVAGETGLYVAMFPTFPAAHSQGETLDELNANLRDVIAVLSSKKASPGNGWRVCRHTDRGGVSAGAAGPGSQASRGYRSSGYARLEETRQRGSHKRFRHPDGRATTVPVHAGRDLSPTLLRRIARG